MTRCRTCKAEVVWGVTPAGKWMPVDGEPHEEGNVTLERRVGQPPIARVLREEARLVAAAEGRKLHRSHFASCPDSAKHRRAA